MAEKLSPMDLTGHSVGFCFRTHLLKSPGDKSTIQAFIQKAV